MNTVNLFKYPSISWSKDYYAIKQLRDLEERLPSSIEREYVQYSNGNSLAGYYCYPDDFLKVIDLVNDTLIDFEDDGYVATVQSMKDIGHLFSSQIVIISKPRVPLICIEVFCGTLTTVIRDSRLVTAVGPNVAMLQCLVSEGLADGLQIFMLAYCMYFTGDDTAYYNEMVDSDYYVDVVHSAKSILKDKELLNKAESQLRKLQLRLPFIESNIIEQIRILENVGKESIVPIVVSKENYDKEFINWFFNNMPEEVTSAIYDQMTIKGWGIYKNNTK